MKVGIALAAVLALLGASAMARADNSWTTDDYDLHAGDFDGDGRSDMLYIARDLARVSGIALADDTGFGTSLQTWGNAYLGIPWSGGHYNVVVGDFNGDGRDDIFLQRRTPGDHYLILTEEGGIGAISQAVPNDAAGLEWSADAHRIIAGDFDGDGRADLLLQPILASRFTAVMLSDEYGQFTATAPAQSWLDGYAGFRWTVDQTTIFAGDFNGDGLDDLLVQARPLAGTGPGTKLPATFEPNANGVLLAQPGAQIFPAEHLQAWGQEGFSAQWSPLRSTPIVGDWNGDGRDDVILQGLTANERSYLLYGRQRGTIFEPARVLDEGAVAPGDQVRVIAGSFASSGADALYFQQRHAVASNRVVGYGQVKPSVWLDDASLATGTHSPVSAAEPFALGGGGVAALQTPTSAGRTPGQFAVSAMGSATYQIPIWAPSGARGIEPNLALVYSSGGPDGALGPGWSLSGLSMLARCNKTYAANSGTPAPVTLTTADDFCLDGNRLRLTSGTYGAPGSVYQTEIADFSRITAYGIAGYGPMYFIVEGKDGLKYEYGTSIDSRAYAVAGSSPYAWLLNKVVDRQGNNLTITYSTTSGDVQPASIQYTQVPSKSATYPYTITFTYQNRVTNLSKYVAGGKIEQTKVLAKINVQSSGLSVRQYNLTYQTAPTTLRDRLTSVQECSGYTGVDCLRPTTIAYQNGQAGIASPTTSVVASSTSRTSTSDVNGDGKSDLIYSTGTETAAQWYVRFANADGSYGSAVSTGLTASSNTNSLFGDFYGDGKTAIVAPVSGVWQVARWNGSAFVTQGTGITFDASSDNALADTDGDGLPDLVTLRTDTFIYVRRNMSTQYTPSLAAATQALYWGYAPGGPSDPTLHADSENIQGGALAGAKFADFNGDGRQDIIGKSWGDVDFGGFLLWVPVYHLLLSNGGTLTQASYYAYAFDFGGIGNVNNDACTDLVLRGKVYVSPCNGGQIQLIYTAALPPLGVADWDGDGRDDLLLNNSGQVQWQRSLGNTFATAVNTGLSIATGARYVSSDSNGDGLVDLIQKGTSGALSYGLHHGAHTPADLATSITDGWGISAAPSYVPITQNNYTKGSSAALPDFDFQSPLYVVSQVQQSDGTGANFTNSFWYTGARVNRQGRGFLGFSQTQTQDSRNGIYRRIHYRQDFPYVGGVSQDDSFQPDGTSLISRTVNTYQVTDLGGIGCASGRCFPYVQTSTATNYEITGGSPLIQTMVSSYTYDSYGNATQVATTTTDNHSASPFYGQSWSSVVSHTITNNATYWCLGKPTVSTTQNTVPGQPAATRRVDHAVDYVNCRFTSETLEPVSALLKVETSFGFDTCGNTNSVSVVGRDSTGGALPARTTTTNYGARCQFPESVTNALGQTACHLSA